MTLQVDDSLQSFQWSPQPKTAKFVAKLVNAFLATSVVFINEIAAACEATGADAKEVERGLKSEARIGPGAYLGPGAAFAGGTLARDIAFLLGMGARLQFATPLLSGVKQSNDVHRLWARRRLTALLDDIPRLETRPEQLRDLRAVEALEHQASVEARRLLAELTKGASEARLTKRRMKRRRCSRN